MSVFPILFFSFYRFLIVLMELQPLLKGQQTILLLSSPSKNLKTCPLVQLLIFFITIGKLFQLLLLLFFQDLQILKIKILISLKMLLFAYMMKFYIVLMAMILWLNMMVKTPILPECLWGKDHL